MYYCHILFFTFTLMKTLVIWITRIMFYIYGFSQVHSRRVNQCVFCADLIFTYLFVEPNNYELPVLLIHDCVFSDLTPACNYAKGKWVPDDNRPLYSGYDCKQWLSSPWACRLTQRTDFAYEKLRWQPKNCQMEEFEGSKFLRKYVK